MANVKISNLTAATTPLAGTEVLPIVQSGATVKASIANVQTAVYPGGTANGVAYLNGSKVLTTGSALVFDGTNLGVGAASPGCKLDVVAASNTSLSPTIRVYSNNLAVNTAISYDGIQGNGDFYVGTTSAAASITFKTNNATKMTLDASGNLGIGTTSPASQLQVNKAQNAGTSIRITNTTSNTGSFSSLQLDGGANSAYIYQFSAGYTTSGPYVASATTFDFPSQFIFSNGGTERARINSSGDFIFYNKAGAINGQFVANKGAGSTDSGGFSLAYTSVNYTPGSASSNIYWDSGTGFFTISTSAQRFKRNITPVTDQQLDKALLLKPCYYQRLEYDYWEYGLIAEEVKEIGLEEFVTYAEGEISGLNYEKMVTLAFGLIQRQNKTIQELTDRITALESA